MEDREMYERARHHAWAGLGFLSVILAMRYFIEFCDCVLIPVLSFLILYITTSLFLTYIFRPKKNSKVSEILQSKTDSKKQKKINKNDSKLKKKKSKKKYKSSKKKSK